MLARPVSIQGAVHEGSGSLAYRLRGRILNEPVVAQGVGDILSRLASAPSDTLLMYTTLRRHVSRRLGGRVERILCLIAPLSC